MGSRSVEPGTREEVPPHPLPTCKPAGGEDGRLENLAGGAGGEMEERGSNQMGKNKEDDDNGKVG